MAPPASAPLDGIGARTWLCVFPVLWIAFLLLFFVPDLEALTNGALTRNFFRHWDANNHWAWQGFIARGDRPFVDFWYPYAGLWVLNLPLPVGASISGFSMNPDGKSFLTALGRASVDLWLLEGFPQP